MEEELSKNPMLANPAALLIAPDLVEDFNEEEILATESSGFDVTLFEGQRAPIESMELSRVADYYSSGVYNPESKDLKVIVTVKTAPLKQVVKEGEDLRQLPELVEFIQEDGSIKYLQVTHRFNLQEKIIDGIKRTEISKHPKASFWKFLKKMGATGETMAEIRSKLIGKLVLVTTTPSKKPGEEDKRYLNLVVV